MLSTPTPAIRSRRLVTGINETIEPRTTSFTEISNSSKSEIYSSKIFLGMRLNKYFVSNMPPIWFTGLPRTFFPSSLISESEIFKTSYGESIGIDCKASTLALSKSSSETSFDALETVFLVFTDFILI